MQPTDFLADVARAIFPSEPGGVVTTGRGGPIALTVGLDRLVKLLRTATFTAIVGNGGSQSIAAHMAVDFWTQARRKCAAPTDPVLLTALANDDGYEAVFGGWFQSLPMHPDLLIAMSCSGRSANVVRAIEAVRGEVEIVTLTGFSPDNQMRRLGGLNFHVPSESYGVVQVAHLAILHAACDALAAKR